MRKRSESERERPTTAQRGYGEAHKKARKEWEPMVERGEAFCSRCGKWIRPGSKWHLDHHDGDRSVYRGPSHEKCNVAAANKRRARGRLRKPLHSSGLW